MRLQNFLYKLTIKYEWYGTWMKYDRVFKLLRRHCISWDLILIIFVKRNQNFKTSNTIFKNVYSRMTTK